MLSPYEVPEIDGPYPADEEPAGTKPDQPDLCTYTSLPRLGDTRPEGFLQAALLLGMRLAHHGSVVGVLDGLLGLRNSGPRLKDTRFEGFVGSALSTHLYETSYLEVPGYSESYGGIF